MPGKILIIQGHPDPAGGHLCHALADAYSEGALSSGRAVRRVEIANVDFPILRSAEDFEKGALPPALDPALDALLWADHLFLIFPLWLGAPPALTKAFLEQLLRPGVAFRYRDKGFPEKLLRGRSARLVVTMGMPAFIHRLFFRSHGIKALTRGALGFTGISPIRISQFGMVEAVSVSTRKRWIEKIRALGRNAG